MVRLGVGHLPSETRGFCTGELPKIKIFVPRSARGAGRSPCTPRQPAAQRGWALALQPEKSPVRARIHVVLIGSRVHLGCNRAVPSSSTDASIMRIHPLIENPRISIGTALFPPGRAPEAWRLFGLRDLLSFDLRRALSSSIFVVY